jgi:DNA-binding MarR family transcriptional regulator
MAETMGGKEHKRLRCLLREAIIALTHMQPEKRPEVKYATSGALILEMLNARGPMQYAEIRDATGLNPSTIQTAIRLMIERGEVNAVDSLTRTGPVRTTRTYSTPEWDKMHSTRKPDFASSWMRNPVLEDEAA